jgi:hypothetical protein
MRPYRIGMSFFIRPMSDLRRRSIVSRRPLISFHRPCCSRGILSRSALPAANRASGATICAKCPAPGDIELLVTSVVRFMFRETTVSSRAHRNFNLGRARTLLLPGPHSIRCPFKEVGSAYGCLYFGSPHVVADGVSHTDKGNCNGRSLQRFDETKQFISCADVDEVDGIAIQKHTLHVGPRGQ